MAAITGTNGNDSLLGGVDADQIAGLDGNDLLYGKGGNDTLTGGTGNDLLDGGTGNDTMVGGTGDDAYYVDAAADTVVEAVGEGTDTVRASVNWTLGVGVAVERLVANGTDAVNLTGNALDNTIFGNAAANTLKGQDGADMLFGGDGDDRLFGGSGIDSLYGEAGADRLDGGLGADLMAGGLGDDSYLVDEAGDVVNELAGDGDDTVTAGVSWTLTAGSAVERLVAGAAAGAISLTGNALGNAIFGNDDSNSLLGLGGDDHLYGRAGADVLNGGTGADVMAGEEGDDTYRIDNAGDLVNEAAGGGTDRVVTTVSYVLQASAEVEDLISQGAGAFSLTGSNTANTIVSGTGADTLSGRGGDDRLSARDGADILDGGADNDTLIGGLGADAMTGGSGDDTFYIDDAGDTVFEAVGGGTDRAYVDATWTLGAGQEVETLTLRGTADLDLTGNELANTLIGNGGVNTLSGGGGDDVIRAGAGDTVQGDAGFDSLMVTGSGLGLDLDALAGAGGLEQVDLRGLGANALSLSEGSGTGFTDGLIRIRGVSSDSVASSDAGWTLVGVENLGGVDVTRFTKGATVLLIDVGVDTSGIQLGGGMVDYDLRGNGPESIEVDAAEAGAAPNGALRIFGDADDSVSTGDGAWLAAGRVLLDGTLVNRFVNGGSTLLVDATMEISGIQTVSAFGTAVAGRQVIDLTSLGADRGFIIQGDAPADQAGVGVAIAGDINGDSYADLIVGAWLGSDGGTYAGEAYVVFGSGSGFGTAVAGRQVVDLTTLSAAEGFIIQGDAEFDGAARSVSSAEDVNGDGYDDLIVGVNGGDDGGGQAGEAYVIFGSDSGFGTDIGGRQVIDLTTLSAAQGFVVQGDAAGAGAGVAVSSAGDINGDGYADFIVGASSGDDGGSFAGEAYVLFGSGGTFGIDIGGRQVIDLTTLAPAQGFIIQGDAPFDSLGGSVSSAGDVNADGLDDIIVGANNAGGGGEAYVVFGSASGFGTAVGGRQVIDVATLAAAQGFVIQADMPSDNAGWSVSAAGDVNGDGLADMAVGAFTGDDGGTDAGEVYVVFGTTTGFGADVGGRNVVDLAALDDTQGFVVQGGAAHDYVGQRVSAAGDVNGDGFADLIVGANGVDGNTGAAYVVFGRADGFGVDAGGRRVIDLSTLSASEGFVVQGAAGGDEAGAAVSAAGDVNGDGFADLIIGASGGDIGGLQAGEAYVLYGGPAGFDLIQIVGDGGPNSLAGTTASERFIGGAGNDVLGDYAGGDTITGGADVFLGGAGDDIIDIGAGSFFRVDGGTGDDRLRTSASLDFTLLDDVMIKRIETLDLRANGTAQAVAMDALDVLAFAASNRNALDSGHDNVLVVRGDTDDSLALTGFGAATGTVSFDGSDYDLYEIGGRVALAIETTVTVTGIAAAPDYDLRGNGPESIAVDAAEVAMAADGALRIFGDADDSVSTSDGAWMAAGQVLLGGTLVDRFINGGSTLLVDAVMDKSGIQTLSAFGTEVAGRQVVDLTFLGADRGFIIQGDNNDDEAGFSVSGAGDINGDGYADLIVGAYRGGDGGAAAGEAYVVFGTATGFGTDVGGRQVIDLAALGAAEGFIIQGDEVFDHAGGSVSSAGDVNGDGFDDLIVGAADGSDGGTYAGEAYVVFGTATGFGVDVGGRQVIDLTTLSAAQGFIIQGDMAMDLAGRSVSSAGDVNGDGFDDVIVGAGGAVDRLVYIDGIGYIGDINYGAAYVLFGTDGGFGGDVGGRQVVDLSTLTAAEGFVIEGASGEGRAGDSVSSAGDVNGDGYDDLIVGARLSNSGGNDSGEAYVVFGKAGGFGLNVGGRQVINTATLAAADGFVIIGDSDGDQAGISVSSAGDLNGDGFGDLVVGAKDGSDGGTYAGEAYVIFGTSAGFGSDVAGRRVIDLTTLDATQGFVIQGETDGDQAGGSVASAGDVNGDGIADLIIGAKGNGAGGTYAGASYVVFGTTAGFGSDVGGRMVLDLTGLTPDEGFIVQGDSVGDYAGNSVSSAGDINGDGFDDLIVGAYANSDGGGAAGAAYVLYGGPAGFNLPQVAGSTDGDDVLTGTAASERLIGGRGNDVLTGNGGADVYIGGEGNDAFLVGSGSFFRVDGGAGVDTLFIDGDLDFTQVGDAAVSHIEAIALTNPDLSSNGAQVLTLDAADVLAFGASDRNFPGVGSDNVLLVFGNSEDTLNLGGFGALSGTVSIGGTDFDLYALGAYTALAVQADIMVV